MVHQISTDDRREVARICTEFYNIGVKTKVKETKEPGFFGKTHYKIAIDDASYNAALKSNPALKRYRESVIEYGLDKAE